MNQNLVSLISILTIAIALPAAAQTTSAIDYDQARNVFTMAPTIKSVRPGVVSISTVESHESDGSTIGGIGSGVIIDGPAGLILTNDHVIKNALNITVTLSDKRKYKATVRGQDPETDLALLEIPGTNLTELSISMSDDVEVGDLVIAVGNPYGLSHSVSTGIVSAIGRTDENPLGYSDLIQTDAAINPGNSGGALVNSSGQLIGINSAIVAKDRGSSGIGFAIPAHTFRAVADQLEAYGHVSRGSLGVMISQVTQDDQARLKLPHLNGAHIVDITAEGSAARAGLRIDDVVTHFGPRDIYNSSDLRYAVGLMRPHSAARMRYWREGQHYEVDVVVQPKSVEKSASLIVSKYAGSIN